jgi:hypothetical protein
MAVIESTLIAAKHGAVPTSSLNNGVDKGEVRQSVGMCIVTNNEAQGSLYRFVEIPTSARGVTLRVVAATTVTADMDLGLYQARAVSSENLTVADVVDADFFGSAVAVHSATGTTNIAHESGLYTPTGLTQPLWQAAGLSADPGGSFELVGTLTASVIGTTGTVGVIAQFTI